MVVAADCMKVVGFGGDDAMVVAVGVRCGGRWRCRLIRGEDGVVVEVVVEMVTGRWGDEGDDDGFVMRR
ncbi:hypothetical protein Tco_0165218 [Tanacetum coccineum]